MKRYRFRLQSVRRVRQTQQDLAAAELGRAAQDLTAREAAERARSEDLARRGLPTGPAPVRSVVASFALRQAASDTAQEAAAARAVAVTRVAERREAWTLAARRVAALDALDDRRRAEHAVELKRWEASMVDDLVTSRHDRKPLL